ncbi:MAG: tRNA pseudouridine(55) synthase TruB [Christensenellales bacterium]
MASGICNLLKPPGMTSRQAVTRVARLTGEKAGHAGTLDPQACGVLPILLGKATRLFDFVASEHKQYLAEICFGVATDTLDAAGSVVASGGRVPSLQEVLDVLPSFLGSSLQTPPAYSARKVDGVRAYKLAREGAAPMLAPHRICIDAITHVAQTDYNRHLIRIVCSKGTYIRTLCQDIGQALHTHAHMSFLLREQTGVFDIADAVTLEELEKLSNKRCTHCPVVNACYPGAAACSGGACACSVGQSMSERYAVARIGLGGPPCHWGRGAGNL